jgi:ribosomal protein S18 acetylase RimI-like enzyme
LDSAGELPLVLRPCQWPADEAFLQQVYASTREVELARVPWSAEQKAAFCRSQFLAQHTDYQRNYPAADYLVIEHGGVPAGRLYVDRRENAIHVTDIALLPVHRGAGIGTKLLHDLQEEARISGKALSIYVEKFNPALSLYERLGFRPMEDQGVYLLMEWRPV